MIDLAQIPAVGIDRIIGSVGVDWAIANLNQCEIGATAIERPTSVNLIVASPAIRSPANNRRSRWIECFIDKVRGLVHAECDTCTCSLGGYGPCYPNISPAQTETNTLRFVG